MDFLTHRGFTGSLTNGAFVTGTTSTLTTTVTIVPVEDGKFKSVLTAITNQAAPTTDFNTGLAFPAIPGGASVVNTPGSGCVAVYGLVAGVVKVVQGPITRLDMQGNFLWDAPQFPPIPATFVPFAYQVLKAGATASATAIILGTASWAATGYTNAIVNVMQLPSRPQVA
jgi:hypothetical protein